MQTTYTEPDVSLTYVNGGLDRFGRIVNHGWTKGNAPLVHILHSYDFAGNRTYRHDAVHSANSELYDYDQINQIKNLDRGVLNANKDAVTTSTFTESWNFDKTGNWLQYDKNGTVENRTHNTVNEIQGIATHDANGNMTLMPGLKTKYDAWNRLVEVRHSSDNLIARYDYNGSNQRIQKTVDNVVTESFFNEQWQELESVTGSELTTYVWGIRYVDDLVLREKGAERLYSLADPNWNVVALIDSIGEAQERMKYDAFGKITWLDYNFVAKANSDYSWNRTFTGQVLDAETGMMLYRNRYYHVGMGRFVSRDPIGYEAKDVNLFRYVGNRALNFNDELGLDILGPTGEAERRRGSGGGGEDSSHHCYAVCRLGVMTFNPTIFAYGGDILELMYPSDDWYEDTLAHHKGARCARKIICEMPIRSRFSSVAIRQCDECCGTQAR